MITKRLAGLTLFFLAGLIPPLAVAADPCINPVSSVELSECEISRAARAEKAMTSSYQQLQRGLAKIEAEFVKTYPTLPPISLKAKLVAAQREWLKFRTQSCGLESQVVFAGNPSRGDRPSQVQTSCEAAMAQARSIQLKTLAKQYEIDLAQ